MLCMTQKHAEKTDFDQQDVEILSRQRLCTGFITVDELRLKHRLFAGGWSAEMRRELAVRDTAVGVLLYDPAKDKVVLVKQFRTGLIDSGQSPWMLEVVAGMVASGEAPIDVVQRETKEETDCLVENILPICEYYNSPGWSSEKVALFCARVNSDVAKGIHGLDEEHEDILVVVMTVDEALSAVKTGQISNAMTLIALQWLALNR